MHRGRLAVVALVVPAVLFAGCTREISGEALRSPTDPANDDGVIVAALDPGNYPVKPEAPRGAASTSPNPSAGNIIEAQRMAAYTVLPCDVDPTMTKSASP